MRFVVGKFKRLFMIESHPDRLQRTSYSVYDESWGGLEFWFWFIAERAEYLGGVEHHMKKPPEYMRGSEASHEHCNIAFGKCWHDGSSLAFDRYRHSIGNDDAIFNQQQGEQAGILKELEK